MQNQLVVSEEAAYAHILVLEALFIHVGQDLNTPVHM